MNSSSPLKVLFISLEFPRWQEARPWSYTVNLGIEEGFKKNNIDYLTINTQYLSCAQQICSKKKFDQVWIEIVHNDYSDIFWEWVANLAPVRIGMAFESLQYTPEEMEASPILRTRRSKVESLFKYLTHFIAVDELDVEVINNNHNLKALWWPGSVPERFIVNQVKSPSNKYALFSGTAYGIRAIWLKHPSLQGIIVQHTSPDRLTLHNKIFNALQRVTNILINYKIPGAYLFAPIYNCILRYIRQQDFAQFLNRMKSYSAVVNLPSFVKTFPGRIVEGMASGCPVISNEIPDRPRNNNLFKDKQEILFYSTSDPENLAEQVRRILDNPKLANHISTNAIRKLKLFHTTEKRVSQVLYWIESGIEPKYD